MMKRRIITGLCLVVCLLCLAMNANAATYRVQKGDSLYSISKKQGVSIDALKKANGMASDRLKPGQSLAIPSATGSLKPVIPADAATYTIKKGDTLSSISLSTGVSVRQILALNDVNPKSLRVGRKLLLTVPRTAVNDTPAAAGNEDALDDEDDESLAELADLPSDALAESQAFLGQWNSHEERKLFVKVATGFLGTPYKMGGASARGMDCSAYVRKMYEFFDIILPRTAREQAAIGIRVEQNELVEGDLVFFRTRKPIGHVGIYIGNNEFVHASYKAKSVRIDRLDLPYFQKRYRHAVRLKHLDHESGV